MSEQIGNGFRKYLRIREFRDSEVLIPKKRNILGILETFLKFFENYKIIKDRIWR